MNQNVVNYLQTNKESYAQNVLMEQLRNAGYSDADIAEGVTMVYDNPGQMSAPIPAVQVKYAGFWIRFAAYSIDSLVLAIPMAIGYVIFNALSVPKLGSLCNYVITWTYFILMTKNYQATLGKQAVGIRVISDKSDGLSWGQLILRETIGKFISTIILSIGYIMAGFTERKQSLHDKMASTVVIYKDLNKKTPVWVLIVAIALPVIVVGLVASIVLASLNSARNKAQDAAMKASVSSVIPAVTNNSSVADIKSFDFLGTTFVFSRQNKDAKTKYEFYPEGQTPENFTQMITIVRDVPLSSGRLTEEIDQATFEMSLENLISKGAIIDTKKVIVNEQDNKQNVYLSISYFAGKEDAEVDIKKTFISYAGDGINVIYSKLITGVDTVDLMQKVSVELLAMKSIQDQFINTKFPFPWEDVAKKQDQGVQTQNASGLDFANAIIVPATTEDTGVKWEYDWLKSNACLDNGGSREINLQKTQQDGGRNYDVMTIVCVDNKSFDFYFMIDNFFGKY